MKVQAALLALAAAAAMLSMPAVTAADRNLNTTISIKGIHCPTCAKKLCNELKKVPGVADSKADVKSGVAMVIPARGQRLPSPRAQWEAVLRAGQTPVRLAGPFGTFTTKPRF